MAAETRCQEITAAVALLKEARRVLNLQHVLSSDPLATDGKTHACDSFKVGAVESYIRTALEKLEGAQS